MSKRTGNKSHRRSWPRYAAVLLAAFCLNLVLQPCAMALDSLGQCPDWLPAAGHGSMSHHTEVQAAGASGESCATGTPGCAAAESYSHEQRGGQLKLKDGPSDLGPLAETRVFLPELRRSVSPQVPRRTSPVPGAPPLNVLYCVYLK